MQQQERELQRQQAELRRMQCEMDELRARQRGDALENDPQLIALQEQDPACANAMRIWHAKQITLSGSRGSGILGYFGNKSRAKELQTYERAMYLACDMPDPKCEAARSELAIVSQQVGAISRALRRAQKEEREACAYLGEDPSK